MVPMRKLIGLCLLLRCSALKLANVASQPSDSSELVDSLVQKAVQAPDCSTDQPHSLAFVIHGVGACENAFKLCTSLNWKGAQVIFLNGCSQQTSLPGHVKTVEVDPQMPEFEALNVGMEHVNDANAIVCLLRDDELPADLPDNTVDLWKSHAHSLFGANPNLGSLVCSHGFIDIGLRRNLGTYEIASPEPYNLYPETRTGDDCCDKYGCGSTDEVYPRMTHKDSEEAFNAARRDNFLKRRFSYVQPGWSASTQWVRKSAWKAVGGFAANVDKTNPFFEIEFQYKLYLNGFAFGQYDCEVRSSLPASPPPESELWTLSKRFNNSRRSSRHLSEFLKFGVSSGRLIGLPMISSYSKYLSDAAEDEGRALQHYDFQHLSPFKTMVELANQRLDLKYVIDKFPLRRGNKPSPPQSSLPSLSDPTGDKVTLIVMSYKRGSLVNLRDNLLTPIVERVNGYAAIVDKLILVWNGDISDMPTDIQEFSNKQAAFPIEIVPFATNTLLNRYDLSLLQRINTQGVTFLDDDDTLPVLEEMQLSFSFWRCDVRRATYLEGRMTRPLSWPFNVGKFDYVSNSAREFSQFGVPYGSVVSKKWLSVYMSPQYVELQKFVIGHPCKPDDIAFGLMIQFLNRFNGAAPTVIPRVVEGDMVRKSDVVPRNKEQSSTEGMAGSPRWGVWRKESLAYLTQMFVSYDTNWVPNVEECYPHRMTDECRWKITKTDAHNMLSNLAKVCPVI